MAFKLPKEMEFAPQGEAATVAIVDIETGSTQEVNVQYGLLTTGDGAIQGHRYHVHATVQFMGRDTLLETGGVDAGKAIDQFIVSEMKGDVDDYDIEGLDDEYFDQKYTKPKEDTHNPWKAKKFDDVREELNTLRGETESALQTVMDKDTDSQAARVELAVHIKRVHELVGGDRKAMSAWAAGATEADGENMALLAKLGKGDNALQEAMLFAVVPDAVMSVAPNGITSGKGLQRHMAQSIKAMADNASPNKVSGVDLSEDAPTIDGVYDLLTHIAIHAFGVANAADLTGDGMVDAVDEAAAEHVAEFGAKYGKHVNTYDNTEYTAAKLAMGCVLVSTAGNALFKSAVDAVNAYHALDDDDAEGMKKIMSGMFSKTGGNALLKEVYKAAKAHAETVAKEAANRDAVKAAVSGDSDKAVFSKSAKSGFNSLAPLAAAAELYAMLDGHPETAQVEAALKGLMQQGVKVAA